MQAGFKQANIGRRKNEEKKGGRFKQSNGPSSAARAALSWSLSRNRGRDESGAPGHTRTPEPACTLAIPGEER